MLGRLQDFDFSIVEAAQDLGAGWWATARRVLLPMLAPGLAAGGLLAFTLSVDDFVITFFVAGPGATTLPIRVYSMIKHGATPADQRPVHDSPGPDLHDRHRQPEAEPIEHSRRRRLMKLRKILGLSAAATVLVLAAASIFAVGCKKETAVLHVYTWADYIKPEIVARFEKDNACKVVIDTFDSNEAMYAKIKAGATGYDIITPTSYMVSLLQAQGMLQPLDKALLPNTVHIDPDYLKIAIDKIHGPLRPLHADQHRDRLSQEQGQGFRADLGHVRPGRPARAAWSCSTTCARRSARPSSSWATA